MEFDLEKLKRKELDSIWEELSNGGSVCTGNKKSIINNILKHKDYLKYLELKKFFGSKKYIEYLKIN